MKPTIKSIALLTGATLFFSGFQSVRSQEAEYAHPYFWNMINTEGMDPSDVVSLIFFSGNTGLPAEAVGTPSVTLDSQTYYMTWSAIGSPVAPGHLNAPEDNSNFYEDWADSYALNGEDRPRDADPDGDGISNFLERTYGLDPNQLDSNERLPFSSVVSDPEENIYLSLTYVRIIDDPLVDDIFQISDGFSLWDSSGTGIEEVNPPVSLLDGTEKVTIRLTTPLTPDAFESALGMRVVFVENIPLPNPFND